MTVKVTGLSRLTARVRAARQIITEDVRKATEEAAYIIMEESEANAPVLTGRLEASHEVVEDTTRYGNPVYVVRFEAINPEDGFDYGAVMHESVYDLGPESEKKQQTNGHIVGRKFLERAVDEKYDECVDLVRSVTKRGFRKALKNV